MIKWGVVYPQAENSWDTAAITDFVRGVESLGYDYLHAYEHILGAEKKSYPDQTFLYTHEHSFREPFVMYAYLAGLTSRLEFVTGILVLPQRDVRLVAKQAAELSMLSGGRFRLGVGEAGIGPSSRRWVSTSPSAVGSWTSSFNCFACSGQSRWSTSRESFISCAAAASTRFPPRLRRSISEAGPTLCYAEPPATPMAGCRPPSPSMEPDPWWRNCTPT